MLSLRLIRKWPKSTYTIGQLYINGVFFQTTLEDPDRGLTDSMTEQQILKKKVYGQTAIPKGTYRVQMTYSPKFASRPWAKKYGGLVPQIMGTKGFTGARFHPLNKPEDTFGCIGVGKNSIKGQITNSTEWYYKLMDEYLWPAHLKHESIYLTIE